MQVSVVYVFESKLFELTKLLNLTNDSITGKNTLAPIILLK